ncbi:MAG: hypothetical protein LAP21_08695 [Acidobacteriia bacterium]|nr:hypothetical protein [Terriglobia bacterium]
MNANQKTKNKKQKTIVLVLSWFLILIRVDSRSFAADFVFSAQGVNGHAFTRL